jgi:hypothetical protein
VSRGDLVFARLDVSLFFDPSFRRLSTSGKLMYLACYAAAVERRTSVLSADFDTRACSDRAGLDPRSGRQALQNCCDVGRLRKMPDGRIHVPGVRANHNKIKGWTVLPDEAREDGDRVDGEGQSSPCGDISGQEIRPEETRERQAKQDEIERNGTSAPDVPSIPSLPVVACLPQKEPTSRMTPPPPTFAGWSPFEAIRFVANGHRSKAAPALERIALQKSVNRVLDVCREVYSAKAEGRVLKPGGLLHKLLSEIES